MFSYLSVRFPLFSQPCSRDASTASLCVVWQGAYIALFGLILRLPSQNLIFIHASHGFPTRIASATSLFVSFMAAPFQGGSAPENRPMSRHLRHDHDRKASETIRRRDSHIRRPHKERHRDRSGRCRSPRQRRRSPPYQLPSPLSTPNSSTLSLNAQVENARSLPMERTPSGNMIISDHTYEPQHNNTLTHSDEHAASRVESHFRRRSPHGKQERDLRYLIKSEEYIDDDALDRIRAAVDAVFFNGVLSGRVVWEWSHQSDERYKTELIGTTALRPDVARGGYETLIVLSKPILKDGLYDRRLVLSAFIHELIHCYLFILCGFDARKRGGHTKGFHTIAEIIDKWVGVDNLRLCNMKANLNHFRLDRGRMRDIKTQVVRDERHSHEGCNQSPRPHSGYQGAGVYHDYT